MRLGECRPFGAACPTERPSRVVSLTHNNESRVDSSVYAVDPSPLSLEQAWHLQKTTSDSVPVTELQ